MELPPSIFDNIAHAVGILQDNPNPVWMDGAASMLRSIADDIERIAQTEKNNLAAAKQATP